MQKSFSQISINSRIQNPQSLKSKHISTTNYDSNLSQPESLQSICSNNYNQTRNIQAGRTVQRKIQEIQAAQNLLSEKYQKVIANLILEISRKDQANTQLEKEVAELTQELQQSKKDLSIIVSYLKRKESKNISSGAVKATLNSTKASEKIDKSVSGSKKNLHPTLKLGHNELKSKSPRQLFTKQTLKW